MSKAVDISTDQISFLDSADAKLTLEIDGASTLWIKGDDGSEIGFIKNATLVRNHTITSSSPYAVPVTVDRLGIRNTSETNPFIINLPSASTLAGRTFRFKDEIGNAGSFQINLVADGSDLIDNTGTIILNVDNVAITIYCDGSNWFIE